MDGPLQTELNERVTITNTKSAVEHLLDDYFAGRLDTAEQIDQSYAQLWNSIHNLYTAGGKRLRPYVTLLTYSAYSPGSDLNPIIPAAASQELLHLAMLIHDDIIDRDRIRYGAANVGGQYDKIYASKLPSEAERHHFSDSAALLAGDLLLSDSYRMVLDSDIEPALILDVQRVLNDSIFTVVGGELLDTETAFTPRAELRPLEIAQLKTASYTFIGPMLTGAILAGASSEQQMILRDLGMAMGTAYQLQDDYLGVFGDSDVTGKSVTSDISEGKFTKLVQTFYELADEAQRVEFNEIFGKTDQAEQTYDRAKTLLTDSGAKAALKADIEQHCDEAEQLVQQLSIDDENKHALLALIKLSKQRGR